MRIVHLAVGLVLSLPLAAAQALSPSPSPPFPETAGPPTREALLSAATDLMQEAGLCTLVTLDAEGAPQARLMDAFPPEADLTVWLATNPKTRKVGEIRRDSRVTLFYLAPDGAGYVALHGSASLVDDPAEKAKRWKPEWKSFYRDESRGSDYLLIRVRPTRLEIVSAKHGIATEPDAWAPAILDLR